MPKSNLKIVKDDKLPKLTYKEQKQLAEKLVIAVGQDDDAVEILLLIAVQMMEHCHDMQYIDSLGMMLAQSLSTATMDWSNTLRNHVEAYRRKAVSHDA